MRNDEELVFVYNANSGLLNSIKDLIHKNVRPATYPCKLCAITYNNTGIDPKWKRFIDDLQVKVTFLHKDEFAALHPGMEVDLPAAFLIRKNHIRPFITSVEMNGLRDLDDLIDLVRSRS
jgi:hypothetical protein